MKENHVCVCVMHTRVCDVMYKECCVYSEVYGGPWTLEMGGIKEKQKDYQKIGYFNTRKSICTCHVDFLWVDGVWSRGPGSIGQVGTGAVVHDIVHFRLQL